MSVKVDCFRINLPLYPVSDFPKGGLFVLPKSEVEVRFSQVSEEVDKRWNALAQTIDFPCYKFNQNTETLKEEYSLFNQYRFNLHTVPGKHFCYSNPDFKIAQELVALHRYRQPNCITFEHSKADNSYNCTCLEINGRKFFALEGPSSETLEHFYRLLTNWSVEALVCLTGEQEGDIPKCYPYWENRVLTIQNESFFALPIEDQYEIPLAECRQKEIPFLHIPHWKDHEGFDVEELVENVNLMRKRVEKNEILAIHCSAGVGRTGTFLALVALFDEIDRQIENGIAPKDIDLSIAKMFLKINFYRRPLVAKEPQYLTLHRAVDYYLEKIQQ